MFPRMVILVLLLLATACRCGQEAAPRTAELPEGTAAYAGLPFIHDDYDRALRLARERMVPLFVETWAPWCHSCLSMKRTVLPDPRLRPMADRYVWLALDTEKEENAAFLEKFPQQVWPTLLLLEPETERPLLRSLGAPTVDELLALLEDGLRAMGDALEGADALLAEADRLVATGDFDAAVARFEEALASASTNWVRRPRAVLGLLTAQRYGQRAMEACARAARRELPKLERSASRAKVASLGLRCAVDLGEERREDAVAALEAEVRDALAPPPIEMGVDDRSNLYELLTTVRKRLGDEEGAKASAAAWLEFLEKEAAEETDAEIRAIYDSHRLLASLLLETPERMIEALRASEAAAPDDYNAPARLALVLHRLSRLDEALAASDRALAKVYGPRKARVLNERGAILADMGERALARAAHASVIEWAEGLPPGQRPHREMERAKAALEALGRAE